MRDEEEDDDDASWACTGAKYAHVHMYILV